MSLKCYGQKPVYLHMLLKRGAIISGFLVVLLVLTAKSQAFELKLRDCGEHELRHIELFTDRASAVRALQSWLQERRENGFLAAGYDTLRWQPQGVEACLQLGPRFRWAQLDLSSVPLEYLALAGYKRRPPAQGYLNMRRLDVLSKKLLALAENDGYPFASLQYDGLSIQNDSLSAQLRFNKGKQVFYDSLRIGGSLKLRPKVLARYLQIREGQVYSENDIQRMARNINALPYASITQNPQLFFYNNKASVVVYADKRRVNSFDGMLGLFPGAADGRLLLTGDINLLLWSAFSRGELLTFNWRSLQPGTQDLRSRLRWPFLFNTPVGIDLDFRIFRRDSSFLEVQSNAGLEYTFSPGNYLKGFYQQRSYRLLGSPLASGISQARVDGNVYGLEYSVQRLDRAFNPYRGFSAIFGAGAGRRAANAQGTDGKFAGSQTYDQFQLHTEGQVLVPWLVRWQSVLQWHGRALLSEQLYFNELFRFGGFRTLKGFDEESVLASSYLIFNLEQRFLLDANSWLYLFGNGGWLRNDAIGQNYSDTPYGLGAGITFQTNAGVFSVAYALGSERGAPLSFQNTKVHLGYRYLL